MPRLATSILFLLGLVVATLLPACVSPSGPSSSSASDTDSESANIKVAREHAFSILTEVSFDGETQPVGYLVEFGPAPIGIEDERSYPVGTVLVQDPNLATLGFITPGGRAFAFDAKGKTHDRGYGRKDAHVRAFMGRKGRPRYRRVSPLDG